MVMYVHSNSFDIKVTENGSPDSLFSIVFDNPTGYKYSSLRTDEMDDIFDDYPLGYNIPIQDADDYFTANSSINILNGSDVKIDHTISIMISK